MRNNEARHGHTRLAQDGFDEERFIAAYRRGFAKFQLAWTTFYVHHLAELRRVFDDLEDTLLLAAFGLRPLEEAAGIVRDSLGGTTPPFDALPLLVASQTNAVRLADMTGIPRQTVRRKLIAFQERGWIVQNADRSWSLAPDGAGGSKLARDLDQANMQMLAQLARLLARFDRLMAEDKA